MGDREQLEHGEAPGTGDDVVIPTLGQCSIALSGGTLMVSRNLEEPTGTA